MAADEADARIRQKSGNHLTIDAPLSCLVLPACRDDLERVWLPIIVLDGDVLALDEMMLMQVIARLLVS